MKMLIFMKALTKYRFKRRKTFDKTLILKI